MTQAQCRKSFCKWAGDLKECKAYPDTVHVKINGTKETRTSYYCPKCGWGQIDVGSRG